MDFRAILNELESVLETSKVGVLTTVDGGGYPSSRWMTPTLLTRFPGRIFAVTSPRFAKVQEIAANPKVLWSFQSRTLDRVINAAGKAYVVDEPGLKVEVLEAIGPNLQVFWRVNPAAKDLVVLETEMERLSLFLPLKQEAFSAEAPHE